MSKKFSRVLIMVLGGFVGAYLGYWVGHLAGWSENAEWPFRIGGGDGAIGLSIGMSVLGVFLTGLALALPSAMSARRILTTGRPVQATVLEIRDLGLRTFGAGFGRRQFGYELTLQTEHGERQVRGIQWLTPEELKAMAPGAEVTVRCDPERPDRVPSIWQPYRANGFSSESGGCLSPPPSSCTRECDGVAWLRFLFGLRPRRAVAAAPMGEGANEEVGYPHRESVLH